MARATLSSTVRQGREGVGLGDVAHRGEHPFYRFPRQADLAAGGADLVSQDVEGCGFPAAGGAPRATNSPCSTERVSPSKANRGGRPWGRERTP